jgi:choline kinase
MPEPGSRGAAEAEAAEHEVVLLAAGCSRRLAHLTREVPKSFLRVAGQRIIERQLESLDALGFRRVTAVVGYLKEIFYREIGDRYGQVQLRYVESPDYETTGHGWSLYLAREAWSKEQRPLLLVHADLVYDPRILLGVLADGSPDVIAIDDHFRVKTRDEVLVCGRGNRISGLRKVTEGPADVLGEVIGINRWSPRFTAELFAFMEGFFARHGRNHNWEPVVDAFIPHSDLALAPVLAGGLAWMNVNHPQDLEDAADICRQIPPLDGPILLSGGARQSS